MYLPLGQNTVVGKRDIIGVFDLDTSTVKRPTRDFLKKAEKDGRIVTIGSELPNSFVLCSGWQKARRSGGTKRLNAKLYISPVSTATLGRRI